MEGRNKEVEVSFPEVQEDGNWAKAMIKVFENAKSPKQVRVAKQYLRQACDLRLRIVQSEKQAQETLMETRQKGTYNPDSDFYKVMTEMAGVFYTRGQEEFVSPLGIEAALAGITQTLSDQSFVFKNIADNCGAAGKRSPELEAAIEEAEVVEVVNEMCDKADVAVTQNRKENAAQDKFEKEVEDIKVRIKKIDNKISACASEDKVYLEGEKRGLEEQLKITRKGLEIFQKERRNSLKNKSTKNAKREDVVAAKPKREMLFGTIPSSIRHLARIGFATEPSSKQVAEMEAALKLLSYTSTVIADGNIKASSKLINCIFLETTETQQKGAIIQVCPLFTYLAKEGYKVSNRDEIKRIREAITKREGGIAGRLTSGHYILLNILKLGMDGKPMTRMLYSHLKGGEVVPGLLEEVFLVHESTIKNDPNVYTRRLKQIAEDLKEAKIISGLTIENDKRGKPYKVTFYILPPTKE